MKRSISLDIIRIIACLMVVFMHSPIKDTNAPGAVLSGLSYVTAPCIGLFFMISGSLLLKKASEDSSFSIKFFLKRRFTKVMIPFVFWYAVGKILECSGVNNAETGILWFMSVLCGLYLLTPILCRWLRFASLHEIEFYLMIWCVSLCYPFIKLLFMMNEGEESWIYYFHGYIGYFVLGYYLSVKDNIFNRFKSSKIFLILLFAIVSVASPIVVFLNDIECDFYSLFWYLSITVVLQCVVWWIAISGFVRKVMDFLGNGKMFSLLTEISKLSFGVYLTHILVMRNVLWEIEWMKEMDAILQIVVCALLTLVISVLISFVISKVKYLRIIIGY